MDELNEWALGEMARQAQEARELHEQFENSGALSSLQLASQGIGSLWPPQGYEEAIQAMSKWALNPSIGVNLELLRGVNLDLFSGVNLDPFIGVNLDLFRGVNLEPFLGSIAEPISRMILDAAYSQLKPFEGISAAIIRDAIAAPIEEILRFESTLGELSSSLIGLHRTYAGVGTSFTVTLNKEATDEPAAHKSSFELAAGFYEVDHNSIQVDTGNGADVATIEIDNSKLTGDPPAQIVRLNTLEANISLGPLGIINTLQGWAIDRSENSEGYHRFNFYGVGGDDMRRKIDFIALFTSWAMNKDESAIEHCLSALSFTSGTEAAGPSASFKFSDLPKLPTRKGDKAKWAAVWRLIRELVDKGMNANDIEIRFGQLEGTSHLPGDVKTLRKIIQAGNAGLFDNLP